MKPRSTSFRVARNIRPGQGYYMPASKKMRQLRALQCGAGLLVAISLTCATFVAYMLWIM